MPTDSKSAPDAFSQALLNLEQLRRFPGTPKVFWELLLQNMATVAGAQLGVLLHKGGGADAKWQRMAVHPSTGVGGNGAQLFVVELDNLAGAALEQGHALQVLVGITTHTSTTAPRGAPHSPRTPLTGQGSSVTLAADCAIAVRLETEGDQETWAAAFYLPGCNQEQAGAALKQLRLIAHLPALYLLQRSAHQNQLAVSQFSSVLDLVALLNAEHRFLAVAMTFCNELASRHKCDRVSLGWLQNEYIRLQTISHTERFEKKMEAVRALERIMEEAFDQDEIVSWPPPDHSTLITRDHQAFSEEQKVKFICSLPLRLNNEPLAVITCERNSGPFDETDLRLLTLCAEMAARRLSELKRNDRWFGARWATAARELLAKAVGVEHTWAKVITIGVAVALGVLFFGRMTYRVEAPFILRTDDIAILSAPFNGYIDDVPGRIGDPVKAKDVLLTLDTRDLLLEQAGALADLDRYTREAEKSRATNALAEMRIAQAQAEQARVRLELVNYRLGQATLAAPFAGVIVEGDLKKRIAAPVKQGDLLFKIARTDRMYLECDVKENDIHELRGDATGQIAFTSQPKLKFPVQIERIEPVAQTKDQKNVFVVRCQVQGPLESWWRPGMSGVAKLNVGKRTFFWIITHRTIDFLRMYFWM